MVRPGVLRRTPNPRDRHRPRQHPAEITHERLVEVPARPRGQQHRRQLRRQRVEHVAPVDRLPHVFRDARDGGRGGEVEREAPRAVEGEEQAERHFDR